MLPNLIRSPRRLTVFVTSVILFTLFIGLLSSPARQSRVLRPWTEEEEVVAPTKPPSESAWTDKPRREIHILLPATKSNTNFCKTLLTMAILGYPTPKIVAWGDDDDKTNGLVGGGSHYAKITRVLEYINEPERMIHPEFEDELIFMLDSYDIWFQLPIHTLLDRYETIVSEENERVAHRMGEAYEKEGIFSEIVFGGGKRCAPNQLHTYSCYPVPESPIPYDIRGGATDTILGRTPWSGYRTRYLNSGYIIGPVKQVRPMLERAVKKMEECIDRKGMYWDSGTGTSDKCYHGSDQSIFVEMYGEQEFHREIMRREHRGMMDDWYDSLIPNRPGSAPPKTHIQNAPINDMTHPDFPHQYYDPTYLPGKPKEFGMMLDYWSTLGHQTANAEWDFKYIRHNKPILGQMGKPGWFDCKGKAPWPEDVPRTHMDILGDKKPNTWESIPLYTEVCVGTVPVMIHHNSVDKWHREKDWDRPWWHGRARELWTRRKEQGYPMLNQGIQAEKGPILTWDELCPLKMEPEVFRDISKEEIQKMQEEEEKKKEEEERKAQEEAQAKIKEEQEKADREKEEKEKAEKEKVEKEKAEKEKGEKEDEPKEDPMGDGFFEDAKQSEQEDVDQRLPDADSTDQVAEGDQSPTK